MDEFVSTRNSISQNSLQWLLRSWCHISGGDEEARAVQSPAGEQGIHHPHHFLATETIRAQNSVSGPCFGPAAGNTEEAREGVTQEMSHKREESHSNRSNWSEATYLNDPLYSKVYEHEGERDPFCIKNQNQVEPVK